MMALPNFIVIGAEKAGTTSLDYYLQQHPQVCMSSIKEPRFFAPEFYTTFYHGPRVGKRVTPMTQTEYEALFEDVSEALAIGEVSPQYLYLPDCCQRIAAALPEVRLVSVLRNPVDRAFSAYAYQRTCGYDLEHSFEEALALEPQRIKEEWRPVWHYQALGFYFQQLQRFYAEFPSENIQVVLYDDLSADAIAFSQTVYQFLGVDASFIPETSVKNISGQPKNRKIHNLFNRDNSLKASLKILLPKNARKSLKQYIQTRNTQPKPTLDPETRQKLVTVYREDILKLQDLIDRDLSGWLSP